MKTLLRLSLLCLSALATSLTHAEEQRAPLRNALAQMEQINAAQCPVMKENIAKAKAAGKFQEEMQQGYESLCECMPVQLQALRASLTPAVLAAPVSESEFQSLMIDRVIGKCAAQKMRATYTGPECTKHYAPVRPNSEKYCQCMSEKLAALSDRDMAETGLAASDYLPRAAEAKKKGLPPPQPPPPMKRFLDTDRACSAP